MGSEGEGVPATSQTSNLYNRPSIFLLGIFLSLSVCPIYCNGNKNKKQSASQQHGNSEKTREKRREKRQRKRERGGGNGGRGKKNESETKDETEREITTHMNERLKVKQRK